MSCRAAEFKYAIQTNRSNLTYMVLFFQPRYLEKKGIVVNSQKIKDISLYIYAPTDTFTQVDKFHRREPRYDAERFPTAAFSVFP